MALPTSGPLSFSMIAEELGTSTPVSLRNMSSTAGFSTPDYVSEFYGYGPGGGLTLFYISDQKGSSEEICNPNPPCCTQAWHSGSNPLPDVGDFVYVDVAGTLPLTYNRRRPYRGIQTGECDPAYIWMIVSTLNDGEVTTVSSCF
jgi:hypothetical protein